MLVIAKRAADIARQTPLIYDCFNTLTDLAVLLHKRIKYLSNISYHRTLEIFQLRTRFRNLFYKCFYLIKFYSFEV